MGQNSTINGFCFLLFIFFLCRKHYNEAVKCYDEGSWGKDAPWTPLSHSVAIP